MSKKYLGEEDGWKKFLFHINFDGSKPIDNVFCCLFQKSLNEKEICLQSWMESEIVKMKYQVLKTFKIYIDHSSLIRWIKSHCCQLV